MPNHDNQEEKRPTYVGICPAHEWEGMRRDSQAEARRDLEGHIQYFPDESHSGAKVIEE